MMSEVDIQGQQAPELTRREREFLLLLVEGHSNDEISLALKIARRTVEFHIGNILNKLEAIVDLASPQEHPLAKVGKDVGVGAAAVLITALAAVLIGLLVLGPPLWERLSGFTP
ncbi:MAG: hypothetical protein DWQ07_16190 [Chloroflexi bacterium]|nr:MAG: hypothetical protein DWQ07_16190 [Chloroflexota bacterium]MBL1195292.1 hypothetical protein [Chloroflexota bacterium]NOH12576.1 hypothetical protein [Chloroflexota bacterium]